MNSSIRISLFINIAKRSNLVEYINLQLLYLFYFYTLFATFC